MFRLKPDFFIYPEDLFFLYIDLIYFLFKKIKKYIIICTLIILTPAWGDEPIATLAWDRKILSYQERMAEPFCWTVQMDVRIDSDTPKFNADTSLEDVKRQLPNHKNRLIENGVLTGSGTLLNEKLVIADAKGLLFYTFIQCRVDYFNPKLTHSHTNSHQRASGIRFHFLDQFGHWHTYNHEDLIALSSIEKIENRFFDLALIELDQPIQLLRYAPIADPAIIHELLEDENQAKIFAAYTYVNEQDEFIAPSQPLKTSFVPYINQGFEIIKKLLNEYEDTIYQEKSMLNYLDLPSIELNSIFLYETMFLKRDRIRDLDQSIESARVATHQMLKKAMTYNLSKHMPTMHIGSTSTLHQTEAGAGYFVYHNHQWVLVGIGTGSFKLIVFFDKIISISSCIVEKITTMK